MLFTVDEVLIVIFAVELLTGMFVQNQEVKLESYIGLTGRGASDIIKIWSVTFEEAFYHAGEKSSLAR